MEQPNRDDGPEPMLSTRQAAVIIECGIRTVQRLAQVGELPSVKLPGPNGQYAFREKDILDYKKRLDERWALEYE